MYNVFHVSQLRRCLKVPTEEVKLEEIELDKNLIYKEHPIAILDFLERKTRTKNNQNGQGAMESPFNGENHLGG